MKFPRAKLGKYGEEKWEWPINEVYHSMNMDARRKRWGGYRKFVTKWHSSEGYGKPICTGREVCLCRRVTTYTHLHHTLHWELQNTELEKKYTGTGKTN